MENSHGIIFKHAHRALNLYFCGKKVAALLFRQKAKNFFAEFAGVKIKKFKIKQSDFRCQ